MKAENPHYCTRKHKISLEKIQTLRTNKKGI